MRPIGFFDSGVGGISVLRQAVRTLPGEDYLYFGDNRNAPYGMRPNEEIRALTLRCVKRMAAQPLKALIVACNTATAAAVESLRSQFSFPVIGMEPAIKPALQATAGQVLVLATPATLRMEKFQMLRHRLDDRQRIISLPCPELVPLVERMELDTQALHGLLQQKLAPYRERAGAVVLGCTHFVFLRSAIAKALPGIPILDGNEGTICRLAQCLEGRLENRPRGNIFLHTTGDANHYIPIMESLLSLPDETAACETASITTP